MKKRIYTVATVHLDTSWNWDFETTLTDYLPKTLKENFEYFERFPEYTFSFEGSYRYELMEEYYPEEFEKLKKHIADGRWNVSGSSFENGDMNIPSPEALFRNITYGNGYFNEKFGKRSADIYLPDCFGFGWALPSIAAHCGLKGFTTQKLVWSSAYGVPFDLGKWYGPDGKWIYASLDARNYDYSLKKVRTHPSVKEKIRENAKYDLPYAHILHGVGDRGGSPKEESVIATCIEARQNPNEKTDVICATTDQIFIDMDNELTDEQKEKLPSWNDELIFTDHAVGSYTSRVQGKRFNRRCEQLADAAERTSVLASLLGKAYPQENLDEAWKNTIAHQFHDDITGTSLAKCYKRNWNDYVQALNRFAEEYKASAATVAAAMDTSFVKGIPVAVFNSVQSSANRKGSVSVKLELPDGKRFARVFDSLGREVYAQTKTVNGESVVTFSTKVPSVGVAVYDIRPSDTVSPLAGGLYASERMLENENLKVYLDKNGDVCSIFDKNTGRETLASPIKLELYKYDGSPMWPAWELEYKESAAPAETSAASPSFSIEDYGSARVAIKTVRHAKGSVFTQVISLDSGANSVEFYNEVDWRSPRTLLKAVFPFKASNPEATFDIGLGTIRRTNMRPRLYEVPAQNWADITDANGTFGAAVFSDSRSGWDKRNDNTLRLTCMHTPRAQYREESAQHLMEIGLNRFNFAVYPHEGSWEGSGVQLAAAQFNQPMAAFVVSKHKGKLGRETSLARVSDGSAIIRCIKKAQYGDEIIVRMNEGSGRVAKNIELEFATAIDSAHECYGDERYLKPANVENGKLVFDLQPNEIKTFALRVNSFAFAAPAPEYKPLNLKFTENILSSNSGRTAGIIGGATVPEELFKSGVVCGDVPFEFGKSKQAVRCNGQKITVPDGCDGVYIVAASVKGDKVVTFTAGKINTELNILSAREAVGAWDLYSLGETGYIKREPMALHFTHLHGKGVDLYGAQCNFFKYFIPANGAKRISLPVDEDILILAATAVTGKNAAVPGAAMYDELEKREFGFMLDPKLVSDSVNTFMQENKGKFKFIKSYAANRFDFSYGKRKYHKQKKSGFV